MTYKRLLSYEPKTDEEINELLEIIKNNECPDPQDSDCQCASCTAQHDIVLSLMRMIWHLCKQYAKKYQQYDELVADGIIGAYKLIDDFLSDTRSGSFTKHAWWVIEEHIKKSDFRIRNVNLNKNQKRRRNAIHKYKTDYERKYGFEPTHREIALELLQRRFTTFDQYRNKEEVKAQLDRTEEMVARTLEIEVPEVTLDGQMTDEESSPFSDVIGYRDPNYSRMELRDQVEAAFSILTEQEKLVIGHRFGLSVDTDHYERLNRTKTAKKLGIDKKTVDSIYRSSIDKIRNCTDLWATHEIEKIGRRKPKTYSGGNQRHKAWEHADQIAEEYRTTGCRMIDLANKYGCSKHLIQVILKELKVKSGAGNRRKPHYIWKHQEDVVHQYMNNASISSIAKYYSCGRDTVKKILKACNVYGADRKSKISPIWQHKKAIIDQYNAGAAMKDIAKFYGCSRDTISRVLEDAGLHKPKKYKKRK